MHTHKGIMAALQQNLSGGQADAQYWAVGSQSDRVYRFTVLHATGGTAKYATARVPALVKPFT
jgi:hypothetical protein